MKIIVTLFLVLFSTLDAYSQSFTFFNKKVVIDNSNQFIRANIPFTGGYYTVGLSGVEELYIHFAKLDEEGTVLDYNILDNTLGFSGGNDFIETSDGHLAMIHSKFFSETDSEITLMKFSINGNVLWIKNYGRQGVDIGRGVIHTKDGGFAITGSVEIEDGLEMYAIKTDANGEQEWENHYCLKRSCIGFSIVETLDRGYILGGVTYNDNNDVDMYIVKIDSLGNQIWEKSIGDSRNEPACNIYVLADGNFLLDGGIRENGIKKSYHAKLDTQGNILWEKKYNIGTNDGTIQTPLVFREDSGFIGVAIDLSDFIPTPVIWNFDKNGNRLWTKSITPDPESHVYIRDIDKIDGGYVLTGWRHYPTPQYGWMVTIDEEGNFCEELGCVEMVVDIEEVVVGGQEVFVQISPNPVRGQATIHYQIPKEGVLRVYDYQGRLMDNWELRMNNSSLTLEVGEWASGIYLYSVEIEGKRLASGKLVAE